MYIELMLNKREGINDVLNRKDRYAGNDRVFLSLKDLFQSTMKADVTFRSQPYSSHLQCAYMASAKLFDRARLKKALHEGAIDHPEYIVECYKIYGSLCMAIQDSGHDDEKYRIMQRAIISAVEAINILQNSTSNTAADEVSQQCASAIDCAQRAARIMGYISILPGEWNEFRDIDNAIRNSLKGALILSKMISPRTPPRLRVDAVSGTLYYMKDVLSKIKWYKTHETFTPFPHMVVMEAVAKFYINAIEHYADMREYKALEERPGLTDAHLLTSINIFEGMLIAKEARQKLISFGYASKTPECRGFKQIEDTLNTAYTKFCLEGMRRTHLGYINIQLRTLLYQTQKKTKELAKASWDQTIMSDLEKVCISTERALDRLDRDRILYGRNYEELDTPIMTLFPGEQSSTKHRKLRKGHTSHSLEALVECDAAESKSAKTRRSVAEFFRNIFELLREFFVHAIESVLLLGVTIKEKIHQLRYGKKVQKGYLSEIEEKKPFWGNTNTTPKEVVERSFVPVYSSDTIISAFPDACLPDNLLHMKAEVKKAASNDCAASQDGASSENKDASTLPNIPAEMPESSEPEEKEDAQCKTVFNDVVAELVTESQLERACI